MTDRSVQLVKEYTHLFLLNLKVKFRNSLEYLNTVAHYYTHARFAKIDSYLVFSYLLDSPFAVSKRFLSRKGEQDLYTYGETPLTTLDYISKQCRLSPKDHIFELGCGRGRTCFWLREFLGSSVVGVDHVPGFIKRANEVTAKFKVEGIAFRQEDLLQTDLQGATVIYLYGTCYAAPFIEALIERFLFLPKGTKIITVSYSLTEYAKGNEFEILKRFPARFTWGTADVYLQVKK